MPNHPTCKSGFRPVLLALALGAAPLAFAPIATPALAESTEAQSTWSELREMLFAGREMVEGSGLITMEAPGRATEPALVPITMTLDPEADIRKVTLVIDENPAPVAATFDIAAGAGLTQLTTRVRVNAYTDIHAVAETADGELHVTEVFVKASGGCAAPAAKDAESAERQMGMMKLRRFAGAEGESGRSEAQLMIRHPNNSGLQKDQVTLLYIPAHFVNSLEVDRDGKRLFSMTGGISISEDPNFRFSYAGDSAAPFHVKATDTEGNSWEQDFPASQS